MSSSGRWWVNGSLLLFATCAVLLFGTRTAVHAECYNGPEAVVVNSDADVFLGVLLNVREMNEDAPGQCGTEIHREAIELYESLRWYLSFINQNSGQVASRIVKDSLIPGIKLGLKIFDACGDADLAERQLGALFPELLDDEAESSCPGRNNEEQKPIIGLIDFVGLIEETPEIGQQLNSFSIPYMAVRLDDFLPHEEVAEALMRFAKRMLWDKVGVIYADDDFSMAIAKSVDARAQELDVCFESYVPVNEEQKIDSSTATAFFVISPPDDAFNVTKRLMEKNGNQPGRYQWLFSQPWSVETTDTLAELTGQSDVYALAISPIISEQFESYWMRRKNPSLPPVSENLWLLEYLATMKNCFLGAIPNASSVFDAQWLPCHNFNMPETSLERVLRHMRVLPAVHALNTFAAAFRKARDFKCFPTQPSGYCNGLRDMTRKEFLDEIFGPLQIQHNAPGNRVPIGFIGSKKPSSNKIADVKFSLIRSAPNDQIHELFSYHKTSGIQAVDRSFSFKASKCESDVCSNCVLFRSPGNYQTTPSKTSEMQEDNGVTDGRNRETVEQNRSSKSEGTTFTLTATTTAKPLSDQHPSLSSEEDLDSEESISSAAHSIAAGIKSINNFDDVERGPKSPSQKYQTSEEEIEEQKITDIMIPALFAVHKAGPTPLQCSTEVDPQAIQEVEAFLWALDVVNRNVELLNGIEIGAVVFDTCSSPIKAAHLVSSILAKEGDPMLEEITIESEQLLAVVSATTGDETESAAAILSPNLITTVSAKERSDSRLSSTHQLQVAVPMSVAAKAVIDLLNHAGWTYVSVIYSSHDVDTLTGFRHFQQMAENTQICIGSVDKLNGTHRTTRTLDRVFDQLAGRMDTGSRVVVLWTDESDTQSILSKLHLLSPDQAERYRQLVWISAGGWVGSGRVQNLIKDIGRWFVVRPQVRVVQEFAEHFNRLRPENNERNPWYGEYWEQITQCQQNGECTPVQRIKPSTTTVIQTVYVIASGLARLIHDYCPNRQLLVNSGENDREDESAALCATNTTRFRETLLAYLQNTGTDRPGDVDGEFGFTDQGYGDTPLEIVEVRGGFAEFSFHVLGTYEQDGLHLQSNGSNGLLSIISECSSRKEVCASCVAKQQNQMLIKPSKDRLYVMGLFDVREKSQDGLWSCSPNVTSQGVQQTEAFTWALEYVNRIPDVLPGVQLGAIGLDGCGTPEKRTSEVARALNSVTVHAGPVENQIVGLVVGTPDVDPRVLYELHSRHQLPVLLSASGLEMHPPGSPPLLQLSPSIPITARVVSDVLHLMNWTYVSAVCANQHFPHNAICEEFQALAMKQDVQFAVDLAVTDQPHLVNYWENVASMIHSKAATGAHVLLALLPDRQLLELLAALRKLNTTNQTIVVVTLSSDKRVEAAAEAAASGVIYIRNRILPAGTFFQEFEQAKMHLSNPNPWLLKYWNQLFKCRGVVCQNLSLASKPDSLRDRDDTVVNIINGVLAVAQGLERVRQQLCPGVKQGLCPAMSTQDVRRLVERAISENDFTDINGRSVSFLRGSGVSQEATIEIVNGHQTALFGTERMLAGTYSLREGLSLNTAKLKARDSNNSTVIGMESIGSRCVDCQKTSNRPQWQPSQFMQVDPVIKPGFLLVGLLPFHRQGMKPLSCGPMHSTRVFQNLAAVAMTLDRLRQNASLPTSMQIGAVFFDSCGRVERAQQRLLSFITDSSAPSTSASIIGAITLDGETAQAVSNVLSEASVPQFTTAIDGYRSEYPVNVQPLQVTSTGNLNKEKTWHSLGGSQIIQTVPSAEDEVRTLFDIVRNLAWKHVVIFYDDSQAGSSDRDLFLHQIRQHGGEICVGAQIRVNKFGQGDIIDLHSLMEAIASDLPVLSVAVLLLDNPAQVQHVLAILEDVGLSRRFIVVANHAWGNHRDIPFEASSRQLAGVLTVSMETYPVPGFNQFLAGMTLESHSTIPDDWFEEYFQHHFECHLLGSKVIQRMYPKPCTGAEQFELRDIEQDPYVYHTVAAVETYVKALQEFLSLYCTAGTNAVQFSDCGSNALERFNAVLNDMAKREPYQAPRHHLAERLPSRGYRGVVVWNGQYYAEKAARYERVGFWMNGRLDLDRSQMKFYVPYSAVPSVECLQGPCTSVCSAQSSQIGVQTRPTLSAKVPPQVPTNFTSTWGVVAIVFCVLGLLSCMACVSFFIRYLPKPSPTSILNYFVLAGLALLYITTIFFLIQPSEVSCGLRRFFLGLSYAIIYSGLLVRSVHTWRRITRGQAQPSASFGTGSTRSFDLTDATKPPGLVFTTMTLIAVQVILLSAWLIFKPPEAVATPLIQIQQTLTLTGVLWRCAPTDSFESELVISLILPIVLLFTAFVFSLVVWRSSDAPRNSRSNTACCALLAFLTIIWTLVATQASYKFREPAIVTGNILCAKTILLILYGRKVYEISVRRQESRNLAVLSQFSSKSTHPPLPDFTSLPPNSVYTTDIDVDMPSGIQAESCAAHAEDPAMGLCLGLASTLSRNGSRRSRSGLPSHFFEPVSSTGSCHHCGIGPMSSFETPILPCPLYPSCARHCSARSVDGDRDLSDSEDLPPTRFRSCSLPPSRRGSLDLSCGIGHHQRTQLMVRRVGSRQMLVLGDEASIHGRVSKI